MHDFMQPATREQPLAVPLANHPVVRDEADRARRRDQAARMRASVVREPADPWDLRVLKRSLSWTFERYKRGRSFVLHHVGGLVDAEVREQRAASCRDCTLRVDRGDGIMFCQPQQASCKCGQKAAAGLWWLIKLTRYKCPIGRFERAGGRRWPLCLILLVVLATVWWLLV